MNASAPLNSIMSDATVIAPNEKHKEIKMSNSDSSSRGRPESTRTPRSTPERKQSSSEDLQEMAAKLALRKGKTRSLSQQRTPADPVEPANGVVRPRRRPGPPRRIKSERNVHHPAHRSVSPSRPCLRRSSSEKKTTMRRQVSFGSKCYDEIPKIDEDEKNAIWYGESELKDLRKQVKKLARKGLENETEDCLRGLEPYVQEYQKRKESGPTGRQKCNQLLLEAHGTTERRRSEELKLLAQDLLRRFSEEGAKAAAQDAAEARAIYMETMDQEQVCKCFHNRAHSCPITEFAAHCA